jgi:hypothetical protein
VRIAGQVHAIAGEKINIVAAGAETEGIQAEAKGVGFMEYSITVGRNDRIGRDRVFTRRSDNMKFNEIVPVPANFSKY